MKRAVVLAFALGAFVTLHAQEAKTLTDTQRLEATVVKLRAELADKEAETIRLRAQLAQRETQAVTDAARAFEATLKLAPGEAFDWTTLAIKPAPSPAK